MTATATWRSAPPAEGRFEVLRALAALAEAPGPGQAPIAAALGLPGAPTAVEHTEALVLQCHPYASVHLGPEGMLGGEGADRVAGFWRALGMVPPPEADHLACLLGLYAGLGEAEAGPGGAGAAAARRAREALLWEHLLAWVPPFLQAVRDAGSGWFVAWADLLSEALEQEAGASAPPARLPLALRAAPPPPPAGEGVESLLRAMLAPVRSGMVLTRARLARGAMEVGAGLRQGERLFALRSMLEQDPEATISWLAAEAARWEGLHRKWAGGGEVAQWWARRAGETADRLRALAGRRPAPVP